MSELSLRQRRHYLVLSGLSLLTALLLSLTLFFMFNDYQKRVPAGIIKKDPTEIVEHIPVSPTPETFGIPIHLKIPVIRLDADVEQVGILNTGELDTPQGQPFTNVGWYNGGARPGEHGSAVIDGHLNRPGGDPAIFHDLHEVKPGDEIIVTLSNSKTLHFRVRKVASYPPNDAPLQAIFGDTSGQYLNLITCAGDWVPAEQQTTLRMVVFTSLM